MTSLVKKLDQASKAKKVNSFVVYLNDDEKLEDQLKDFAKTNNIEKTVLTIDNPAGPPAYKISKDAEVTVLLYTKRNVEANFAFPKGALNNQAIEKVIASLDKIAPSSK